MFSLAREFHSFPAGSLKAVTLPTVGPYITSGGANVLLPAAAADEAVIQSFLGFGVPAKKTSAAHTTAASGATSAVTTSATGGSRAPDASTADWISAVSGTTSAATMSATSTTTTQPQTTVTTIAPTPPGETPIYNNGFAPYDPTPC
jgi:hypothetical protein